MRLREKISPKLLLICAAAAVLAAAVAGATLAYFTSRTAAQRNQFTPGVADISVDEPNGGSYTIDLETNEAIAGAGLKKAVKIKNVDHRDGSSVSHSVPVYVRVKLLPVVRWADASKGGSGDPVKVLGEAGSYSADDGICVGYDLDASSWVLRDGFYYYKAILPPGGETPALLSGVRVYGLSRDKKLELQVIADSIQTIGGAEKSAWGVTYSGGNWIAE